MSSEWLRVMLEEIARKKTEAEQAQAEAQRRKQEDPPAVHEAPRNVNNDPPKG